MPLAESASALATFIPVLAQQLGWRTARGQVPFDPVSLFLLVGWQLSNSWNRAVTLRNVAGSRYADLVHCFGFRDGVYPTEGGLRYFLTTLGQNSPCHDQAIILGEDEAMAVARQQLNQLIAQSVHLLLDAGIISPEAWHKASICPDGMLHEAASRLRCAHVRDSCYKVTTAPHRPGRLRPALFVTKDTTSPITVPTKPLTRPNKTRDGGGLSTATVPSLFSWPTPIVASA